MLHDLGGFFIFYDVSFLQSGYLFLFLLLITSLRHWKTLIKLGVSGWPEIVPSSAMI